MYEFLYQEMEMYGRAKFYLLHTFSHLIMKELEFKCGYPTASLSERLYYSDEMCGVLIYTADGAEGSVYKVAAVCFSYTEADTCSGTFHIRDEDVHHK